MFFIGLIVPVLLFACTGVLVNPVSDIAWNCLYPITLGGMSMGESKDTVQENIAPLCWCKKGVLPEPGIAVGFWEPALLMDITRTPWCFVGLNGLCLGKKGGGLGMMGFREGKKGFYHVHVYRYPLLYLLDILNNFGCVKKETMDVIYLSECDPLWNDDVLSDLVTTESVVVNTPMAQLSCAADCAATAVGVGLDSLYWCSGCLGSVFPLTGTVMGVGSDVHASALLVHRVLFKLHRMGLLKGTVGKDGLCGPYTMMQMQKKQYKTQMVFPVAQRHACASLGRSDMVWGRGRSFPVKGEDFCYVVWRRRDCCVLSGMGSLRAKGL
ncbi:MAG: TraU family protein [Alphaproteobacteria bacterium]|nr:TraU family protein [Alphaproteobacteria bacterium]